MKKSLAVVLAVGLAMNFSVGAFAATLDKNSANGTVNLQYTQESAYTVTIPDDITFASANEVKNATVSAAGVVIDHGTKLNVTVKSDNYSGGWKLADVKAGGDKLGYTFEAGDAAVANDGVILEVKAGTADGEKALKFTGPDAAKKSGTYKDALTFTVAVVPDVAG